MFPPSGWTPQIDVRGLRRKMFDNYGQLPPEQQMDPNFMGPLQEPEIDPSFIRQDVNSVANSLPMDTGAPSRNYQEKMDELYTPSTVDRDRFRGLLDNAPVRQEPGIIRSIVASGMGVGRRENNPKLQEDVMYAPHNRAMEDWKAKTTPFYQGASVENSANSQERQLANNVLTNESNMERWAQQNEVAQRGLDLKAQKQSDDLKLAQDKQRLNEWKTKFGYTYDTKGEYVIAHRPDGTTFNTGTLTTNFSPLELEELRHKGDMAEIAKRTEGAIQVRQTVPGGSTKVSVLDKARLRNEALQNAYQTDVTTKPYIKKVAEGKYDFNPRPVIGETIPGTGTFGFGGQKYTQEDVNAYDEFRASVDDTYKPPVSVSRTSTTTTPSPVKTESVVPPKPKPPQPKSDPTRGGTRYMQPPLDTKPANTTVGGGRKYLQSDAPTSAPSGQNVITQASKSQPNEVRKSTDGGKTWQYSHDGGQTWGNQ